MRRPSFKLFGSIDWGPAQHRTEDAWSFAVQLAQRTLANLGSDFGCDGAKVKARTYMPPCLLAAAVIVGGRSDRTKKVDKESKRPHLTSLKMWVESLCR